MSNKSRIIELFEMISAIPRPSYHEEKIADFICDFAKKNGHEVYRDELNNVLVNVEATKGFEDRAPVLLQGHTDMVCEKNEDVEHDFLNEGLDLFEENGFLRARGTTLGADNGVAVAVMLYLIEGGIKQHPAVQCLFTVSEEVGLDGARGFDVSRIYARRMVNMDGESEKKVVVGCAGGTTASITFDVNRISCENRLLKLKISGLRGGHSGENIAFGRANANILMGQLLGAICAGTKLNIVSVFGGSKDNAIPRECSAVVAVEDVKKASDIASEFEKGIRYELSDEDSGFSLLCNEVSGYDTMIDDEGTKDLLTFMTVIKNGVIEMSKSLSGLVEYSRNFGVIREEEGKVVFVCNSRSAISRQLDVAQRELDMLGALCSAKVEHLGRYPGWEYSKESELSDKYIEICREFFGIEVEKEIIHAGLECGVIKGKIPDIDCISCAPNLRDLHSPDEALEIESFERFVLIIEKFLELI